MPNASDSVLKCYGGITDPNLYCLAISKIAMLVLLLSKDLRSHLTLLLLSLQCHNQVKPKEVTDLPVPQPAGVTLKALGGPQLLHLEFRGAEESFACG